MAMERVTVEQNGERFTLEVPEGTSDADITKFLTQQQSTDGGMTSPPAQPSENAGAYAAQVGAQVAKDYGQATGGGLIGDAARIGKILYNNVTPAAVGSFLEHPVANSLKGASAYLHGLPIANMTMAKAVPAIGSSIAQGAVAPENLMTLPYNMAAYEQAKIRENPNAPGLESNPYAQTVRGEASTQGRAGAANQMKSVTNMPYGNVTPQERAMLEEDARMKSAVRKKAFEKVMGPVQPGSF